MNPSNDFLVESLSKQVEVLETQRADLLYICREMVATLTLDRNQPHIHEQLRVLGKHWGDRLTHIVAGKSDAMRPMTREEAEREVKKHADAPPMSDAQIEDVMAYVMSGGKAPSLPSPAAAGTEAPRE